MNNKYLSIFLLMLLLTVAGGGCDMTPESRAALQALEPQVRRIEAPQKILFVGNSFTYYNDGIDRHLNELLMSADPARIVRIESLTTPNQTMKGHYRDEATALTLDRHEWDVVIFQGASYEPVERRAAGEFYEYAGKLALAARERDADVALFMTWSYRGSPSMIVELAEAYLRSGNDAGAIVIPVGLAWDRVSQERSTAFLYSDGKHPSIQGTYLAACVFYAALFDASPVGLQYTAGLDPMQARYLQTIASQTVEQFYARPSTR